LTGVIVQYTDEETTQTNYIDDLQLTSVTIRYGTVDDLQLTSVIFLLLYLAIHYSLSLLLRIRVKVIGVYRYSQQFFSYIVTSRHNEEAKPEHLY
jgi:hypothetical protein